MISCRSADLSAEEENWGDELCTMTTEKQLPRLLLFLCMMVDCNVDVSLSSVKGKQERSVEAFVLKKDVVALLSTVFG